ncbi:MAG: hypothetical protein HY318_11570, partial [Armatimonadetes bacterium]|nr:hypothetical protein [Armatimonadota bacterium]
MTIKPDYSTARKEAGFGWSASCAQGAIRQVTQTPIREFNLSADACIEAYRKGRPMLKEMFGDDVGLPGLATPAISYGHANVLGSELLFPEGGEVAHTHPYDSLEEGLRRLSESVDFSNAGMAPFYLGFRERMREAFLGEPVVFGFGDEGPITTAYELRGEEFFPDMMENPPLAREFLHAVVESVLAFHRWICALDARPPVSSDGGGMCDDLASFIPANLFRGIVLSSWEHYYSGITTGRRSAHVEDLRAEQLPFLEEIGFSHFDPSISPKLTPRIFAENCRVPFSWRLGCIHYREMSCQDIEDFVFQSVADGASGVFTVITECICNNDGVEKVHAFIRAAKEAKRMLDEGIHREEIGERVSTEGRRKLWDEWCGYLSPKSSRGGQRRTVSPPERSI